MLATLALRSAEEARVAAAEGGLEAVVTAMRAHPWSSRVQLQGCSALRAMAAQPEAAFLVSHSGGVQALTLARAHTALAASRAPAARSAPAALRRR